MQERITRLASGVAVIKVGAATEIEMMEKKHRIAMRRAKKMMREQNIPPEHQEALDDLVAEQIGESVPVPDEEE